MLPDKVRSITPSLRLIHENVACCVCGSASDMPAPQAACLMKRANSKKESHMSIPHVVQRTANILRRPSIQRLIMLLVAMLLAMSLGYVTIVVAYPIWEKHVAFLPT